MRTVIDNNILIAEFMGLIRSSVIGRYWTEKNLEGAGHGKLVELEYDTDWNWIIPVVIKCKERQFYGSNSLITRLNNALVKADIELVYEQVIEFINYYNKQNNDTI